MRSIKATRATRTSRSMKAMRAFRDRSMKAIRMKKSVRTSRSRRAKKSSAAHWWAAPPIITTGVVVAIASAMLLVSSQSTPDATRDANVAARSPVKVSDSADAKPSTAPVAAATTAPRAAAAAAHDDAAASTAAEPESVETSAPVTITGCLERDDEMFRLRDASGDAVPKARSWKSGFLKKRTPSIEVVDAGNGAKLPSHVGERVSVTGTLLDRRMTVRSLQRVAASCHASGKVKA